MKKLEKGQPARTILALLNEKDEIVSRCEELDEKISCLQERIHKIYLGYSNTENNVDLEDEDVYDYETYEEKLQELEEEKVALEEEEKDLQARIEIIDEEIADMTEGTDAEEIAATDDEVIAAAENAVAKFEVGITYWCYGVDGCKTEYKVTARTNKMVTFENEFGRSFNRKIQMDATTEYFKPTSGLYWVHADNIVSEETLAIRAMSKRIYHLISDGLTFYELSLITYKHYEAAYHRINEMYKNVLKGDKIAEQLIESGDITVEDIKENELKGHIASFQFSQESYKAQDFDYEVASLIISGIEIERGVDYILENRKDLHYLSLTRSALQKIIREYLDKDATDLYAASFLMSDEEDDGSNDDADEENVVMAVDYNFDDEDDDDELIDPPEVKETATEFEVKLAVYNAILDGVERELEVAKYLAAYDEAKKAAGLKREIQAAAIEKVQATFAIERFGEDTAVAEIPIVDEDAEIAKKREQIKKHQAEIDEIDAQIAELEKMRDIESKKIGTLKGEIVNKLYEAKFSVSHLYEEPSIKHKMLLIGQDGTRHEVKPRKHYGISVEISRRDAAFTVEFLASANATYEKVAKYTTVKTFKAAIEGLAEAINRGDTEFTFPADDADNTANA